MRALGLVFVLLSGCARLAVLPDPRAGRGGAGGGPIWPRAALQVDGMRGHPVAGLVGEDPGLAAAARRAFTAALTRDGVAGEVAPPGADAPLRLRLEVTWEEDLDRLHRWVGAATLTGFPVWRLARLRVRGRAAGPRYLLASFRFEEEYLEYAHPVLLPLWPFHLEGARTVLLRRAGRALAAHLRAEGAFHEPPWARR